jgi:hypothetical protein
MILRRQVSLRFGYGYRHCLRFAHPPPALSCGRLGLAGGLQISFSGLGRLLCPFLSLFFFLFLFPLLFPFPFLLLLRV